ncbi:outer membrane protein assembly factor BamA [uncultured Brachyspira sp.]|uniref:outer membrane protein assembly factor BamA n=1 Tax=uncultured Brachyspira sp. TaxID=221953 RepID=UPI0025D54A86|nr:outer membrane protein assembly factor BamA [uncultured Brachyspira sp.]
MYFINKNFIILFSSIILAAALLIAAESDFKNLQTAKNIAVYEGLIINRIDVAGETRLTKEQIINNFPIKTGSKFSRIEINEAIKKLFDTQLFDRVSVDANRDEKGVVLNIIVAERFIIKDIQYVGNKRLSRTALNDAIKPIMKLGDPYMPQKLNEAVNAIITNYQDKGYLKAYVEPKVTENAGTSDVVIQMDIVEGNEVKVSSIRFHGNTYFSANELKRQMSTKENGFLTLGKFNEFKFEDDKAKVVKYYADRGYYRAKVDNVKFTYQWRDPEIKNEQDLIIDIYITEGDKYYFGDIGFKGNFIISSDNIQKDIKSKKGALYNYTYHITDFQGIQNKYSERGYIFRQVIPVINVNEENKIVSIMYDIVENDKAHIENITITGNTKTKDFVIERYVDIKPGEIFNTAKIQRVQEKLYNTQFFDNINIGVKPGTAEGLMELNLNVSEGKTAMVSGGGGFSTSSGFKIFASIRENNFLGRGLQLGLSGELGQQQKRIAVNFAEPYLLNLPIYIGVDLSYFNEGVNTGYRIGTDQFGIPKYSYYTRHGFEGIVRLGYYFADYYSTFITFDTIVQQYQQWHDQGANGNSPNYVLSDIKKYLIHKVNKKNGSFERWESDWFTTFIISYSLLRDSRNDYLNPTRGSFLRGMIDLYFGHTQLTRLNLTGFLAVPATEWLSFAFYGEIGQIIATPGLSLRNDADVLYYLNPFEDIRGWDTSAYTVFKKNRGLPTYDMKGENGSTDSWSYGRAKVRFFAELRIPIIPKTLGFVTFLDAGQLWMPASSGWNQDGDAHSYPSQFMNIKDMFDPSQYIYSVGFGVRLTIPIFNVRFYIAKRFVYNKDNVGFGKGLKDFEGDTFTPLGAWLGRGWGIAFTMNHPFY